MSASCMGVQIFAPPSIANKRGVHPLVIFAGDEAEQRLSSATAPLAEALHATLTRTPCSGRTMYLSKRLSPSFLLWLQNYRLPRRNFPSIGLWWSPGPYLYLAMHGRASLRWAKFHGALLFELVFLRAAFCIEAVNLCFSQGHGLR